MSSIPLRSFLFIGLCATGFISAAVDKVELFREVTAWQASSNEIYTPQGAYRAVARVITSQGYFSNGFLSFPSSFFLAMSYEEGAWTAYGQYNNSNSPFAGFPQGDYTFSFEKNAQWLSWTLGFGGGSLPPQPILTQYRQTQEIVPGTPLLLQWQPWPEAQQGDVIEVEIVDETTLPGQTVFLKARTDDAPLSGQATNLSIPTANLVTGNNYTAYVRFIQTLRAGKGLITGEPQAAVHFGNVATTGIALRLATEEPLIARLDWNCVHERNWMTAGDAGLSPAPQTAAHFERWVLFTVDDWFSAPFPLVKFHGPANSGLINTPASFSSYTRRGGTTYHTLTAYSADPPAGDYTIAYKAGQFTFANTVPPAASTVRFLSPTVSLDTNGRIEQISWHYILAATGEPVPAPTALESVALYLRGRDGTVYLDEPYLSPEKLYYDMNTDSRPLWKEVEFMAGTLKLTHGDDYTARYWVTHLEHPAQIYFDGAAHNNGWCDSSWYGQFNVHHWPWIYHSKHGWQQAHGEGESNILLYDTSLGWIGSKMQYYPFIYRFTDRKWYRFDTSLHLTTSGADEQTIKRFLPRK